MSQDYIKLSKGGIEAGGRHVLHALYGYLAFQLISRVILWTCLLATAASGSVSVLSAIARRLW
jgi:hypothetical protein